MMFGDLSFDECYEALLIPRSQVSVRRGRLIELLIRYQEGEVLCRFKLQGRD